MATSRPDVRVYLTQSNFDALQQYCQENGIKSQSAAIDRILTQFFTAGGTESSRTPGGGTESPADDIPSEGLGAEVADLRKRLEAIERLVKRAA